MPFQHVANTNIEAMHQDVLYHLGLTYSEADKGRTEQLFGDVQFFVCGGSADRMSIFAHKVAEELGISTPFGYGLSPIGSTSRYTIFKVGPVLVANHGMGMPSMSILLHEVTKLLEYAGAKDVVYIRMGTSGGVGVGAGTVVLSSHGLNHELRAVHSVPVLGKVQERPAILNEAITNEIADVCKSLSIPHAIGKTVSCDDFYEEQGRLDGAICDFTEADKMAFLQRCFDAGARNIEMEARAFAAFCYRLDIPAAVACVTIVNRLLGDQVNEPKEVLKSYDERPMQVILAYVKRRLLH